MARWPERRAIAAQLAALLWFASATHSHLPFLLLIGREQPLEAFTWMTLGLGALAYDVRQILRSFRSTESTTAAVAVPPKREDNVLDIMESNAGVPVATRNYTLQVRR